MADVISEQAAKNYAVLVTFRWGLKNIACYTDWASNLTIPPVTFASLPRMEVNLNRIHGGAEDTEAFTILMDPVLPVGDLVKPTAFQTVHVTIEEMDPRDGTSRYVLAAGTVFKATLNPEGKTGMVRLHVYGPRARLRVPLGVMANATCNWTFCDRNCGKRAPLLREFATVQSVHRKRIRVTGHSTNTPSHWTYGFAMVDRLYITIVKMNMLDTVGQFYLKTYPPASWVGKQVYLLPGCDHQPDTCENKWNNIENFGGFGVKLPAYHPQIDVR